MATVQKRTLTFYLVIKDQLTNYHMRKIAITIFIFLIFPLLVNARVVYQPTLKTFSHQLKLEKEIRLNIDEDCHELSFTTLDLGGDGQYEIAVALGQNSKPFIFLFDQNGFLINKFLAYNENFTGGVNLVAADLDNDGKDEIITAPMGQGGPHIRILDGFGKPKLNPGFFAYDQKILSGVKIAILRNKDKTKNILTYNPEVGKLYFFDYNGQLLKQLDLGQQDVNISTVDLGGDGQDEIILSNTRWQEPLVTLIRDDGSPINKFLVYNQNFNGGVKVVAADLDDDGKEEIISSPQILGGPHLRIFDGFGREKISSNTFVYDQNFHGGFSLAVTKQKTILTLENNLPTIDHTEKYIDVDISEQKLRYYQFGIQLGEHPISSGMLSMPTPLGEFRILNKSEEAYSRAYNLYMPYWMGFTTSGAGLHGLPFWKYTWGVVYEGVNHLGSRVSHGCVRLAVKVAKNIYSWADIGTPVNVHQ